ncbi:MAG TPA: hypothetical protein VEB22_12590 [Phycisphaerales bacterium]|nr:hypothetical protein [Phycisphaerales bacterium]
MLGLRARNAVCPECGTPGAASAASGPPSSDMRFIGTFAAAIGASLLAHTPSGIAGSLTAYTHVVITLSLHALVTAVSISIVADRGERRFTLGAFVVLAGALAFIVLSFGAAAYLHLKGIPRWRFMHRRART